MRTSTLRVSFVAVLLAAVAIFWIVRSSKAKRPLREAPLHEQPQANTAEARVENTDPNKGPSLVVRSIPSKQEIEAWRSRLDNMEKELTRTRQAIGESDRVKSEGDVATAKLEAIFQKVGVSAEEYSRSEGEERWKLLRSPRLQTELLAAMQAASVSRIWWDRIHGTSEPEKWLSPVYRKTVRDWVTMDPAIFLGGRVQFISKAEYLPYAGVDMEVYWIALSDPKVIIDLAWQRRDSVPATSYDILLQTVTCYAYRPDGLEGADASIAEKVLAMGAGRNPTFRLMGLHLCELTGKDAQIRLCSRASGEVNQVFWKVALERLAKIGGPAAVQAAKGFRLSGPVVSDGTAFPIDADVARQIDLMIDAVVVHE